MFILKFVLYFAVSFIILSFPVGDKTVFEFAHQYTYPLTKDITNYITKQTKTGYDHTKKMIFNFIPSEKDTVKSGLSSVKKYPIKRSRRKKVVKRKSTTKKPMGEYTPQEKMMLERILNSASTD